MIDLHVHSDISDGKDSVETILRMAHDKGIKIISFVDHDTTETIQIAKPIAESLDIELIPGIEISAYDFKRRRKVHVLGYNYRTTQYIDEITRPILSRRHNHSLWQLNQIIDAGYRVDEAVINNRIKKYPLYKQHIMNALIELPYDDVEYQKLYQKLFKNDGVASGDIEYVDVKEAIKAIKQDFGKVVIAHPGQLDSYDLIQELLIEDSSIIDGIETWHYDHSEEDVHKCNRIAQQFSLIETGGSDYHGAFGASYPVGYHTTSMDNYKRL
ncbi:phosphatase [Macrococcoides canis]|uniref:Phosphatase n=1 Tax=Macrococcoides canis TaxID=1855823 RepID=A0AAE6X0A4_9STAP|nr:PHP domain-containing protein [Macrococcus canis]QIH77603.1 phosphatase [Macrococcus canis]